MPDLSDALAVAALLLACVLAGACAALHGEVLTLRRKLMKAWQAQANLRRTGRRASRPAPGPRGV